MPQRGKDHRVSGVELVVVEGRDRLLQQADVAL
jgi:hypothetical protein